VVIWYIFSRFGILYQENSGHPGSHYILFPGWWPLKTNARATYVHMYLPIYLHTWICSRCVIHLTTMTAHPRIWWTEWQYFQTSLWNKPWYLFRSVFPTLHIHTTWASGKVLFENYIEFFDSFAQLLFFLHELQQVATGPGLPDFSWYMIPKLEKMYQVNTECTKWS
jgi:hypothetical protein